MIAGIRASEKLVETELLDTNQTPTVAIVGAGLAGLCCAVRLTEAGVATRVYEASDRVGGRVRSDVVDGFTLDHGFQVLLTAYPACRQLLDYPALRLKPFEPGALVRHGGQFALLGDPWRRPLQALQTATAPIGSFADKLRIARLRYQATRGSLDDVFTRTNQTTQSRLIQDGFSSAMIDEFFRPFLGGVYLDPTMETSSRMLEFVFRMFAGGDIAIPEDGMAAIPRQLAERLPRGTISLCRGVDGIVDGELQFSDGQKVKPQQIIIATESNAAARLVNDESIQTKWRTTTNLYFACDQSPNARRLLLLAGDEYLKDKDHLIGTVVVLSDVAASYAPAGKSLITVSLASDPSWEPMSPEEELRVVRKQLEKWFGGDVNHWQHLQTYRVPYGLPVVTLDKIESVKRCGTTLLCGDYLETPSIQGAMHSGLTAADTFLKSM